jgi:hypothetical protein
MSDLTRSAVRAHVRTLASRDVDRRCFLRSAVGSLRLVAACARGVRVPSSSDEGAVGGGSGLVRAHERSRPQPRALPLSSETRRRTVLLGRSQHFRSSKRRGRERRPVSRRSRVRVPSLQSLHIAFAAVFDRRRWKNGANNVGDARTTASRPPSRLKRRACRTPGSSSRASTTTSPRSSSGSSATAF